MEPTVMAYLSGAMDSDGYFSIRRSTYHCRVMKDATNATYSERIGLHQVTPDIPELLQQCFGGTCYLSKPQAENRRGLYRWTVTDLNAAKACAEMLPYLRVKHAQAKLLLELRESKAIGFHSHAYWFKKAFPDWERLELISTNEAIRILGYRNRAMISQAIRTGTLVGLLCNRKNREAPRIPRILVDRLLGMKGKDGKCRLMPTELIEWRERLCSDVRELNKTGVNGTPIYHRTGPYAPIG